jgi:hypothetical protein
MQRWPFGRRLGGLFFEGNNPLSLSIIFYKLQVMKQFVLIIFMALVGVSGFAQSGTCGDNLTWALADGTLTISGTGRMADYAINNSSPWYSYRYDFKIVVVEPGVENIGNYAFYGCMRLTSITLPESLTSIGNSAFYHCEYLASITLPESLTTIGNYAFGYCISLASITLPESVTVIEDRAFYNCSRLESIIIPESVTVIKGYVFYGCSRLASITFPESLTTIGNYAFRGCGMTSITLPESVTTIVAGAFAYCESLVSITIPESVTTIGALAFARCGSLTGITVAPNNPAYSSEDGVLFNKNKEMLVQCPGGKAGNSYTIPSSVTSIEWGAFSGCSNLAAITLPESLTTIGNAAFSGCSRLAAIMLPEVVTTIGGSAFYECVSLASITLPESLTTIGGSAFYGCSRLVSITIPEAVTTIESPAFSNCTSLTGITVVPNNPAYSSEDGVLFDKNKDSLIQYSGGKVGDSYTIPSSVTSIGEEAFYGCSRLVSITIPEKLTSIGGYAFYGCVTLTSITLPKSVTTIEWNAFNYCGGLTDITVHWTMTPPEIDNNVFPWLTWSDITLHVPAGTKAMYEAAEGWNRFNIVEQPPVGLPTVSQAGGWKAYVDNGVLRVSGLAAGEVLSVYDASGKRVYRGAAATVPLAVRGVYIIRTETRSVRVVY